MPAANKLADRSPRIVRSPTDRQERISIDSRVVLLNDILVQNIDEQTVFLNLSNEHYYGVDAIGSRMWQLLTTKPSIGEALDVLITEFDADPGQIRTDLLALVATLHENGLIDVGDQQNVETRE